MVIGDFRDIAAAFARRGWLPAEETYSTAVWKTIKSFLFGSRYRYSPVSPLYFLGRHQDFVRQKELRAVFSIHHELLTLVAAVDPGIQSIADLRSKRVSLGNPGFTQHRIVVDAYFFTVGHPSETIRMALSNERKARIVQISGPAIDKLVADNPFYIKTVIGMQRLYPGLATQLDEVATFGVVATLCTSTRVPEEVVYTLTKIVFENLDEFRRQHPAFAGLTKKGMREGLTAPLHPGAIKYYKEAGLMK